MLLISEMIPMAHIAYMGYISISIYIGHFTYIAVEANSYDKTTTK